jgi:hypothetical protein
VAVYCTRCNTANREGSKFCNSCGQPMAAPATATCPNCHATVDPFATYCHRCGAQLPQPRIEPIAAPPPLTETDEEAGEDEPESDVISLDQVPSAPTVARAAELGAVSVPTETAAEAAVPRAPVEAAAPEPEQPAAARSAAIVAQPPVVRQRRSPGTSMPVPDQPRAVKDRSWRYLTYAAVAFAVILGILLPQGLLGSSAKPAAEVQALYDRIQALPPSAHVLVSFDYDTTNADELNPLAQAVLYHLARRQAQVVAMSLTPQGPTLADQVASAVMAQLPDDSKWSLVNIGYLSGGEAALANLPASLARALAGGAFAVDTAQPRAAADLNGLDMVIDVAGDASTVQRWVEQVQRRYGVTMGAATSATALPLTFAYLQSGQLAGLASGSFEAAQYEQLLGYAGGGTRSINPQTLAQLAILIVVVAGLAGALLVASRRRAR